MRRLLGLLAAALGGLALYRLLAAGRTTASDTLGPADAAVDPRADELRRKLAESRALVDEREVFEEAETTVDRADPEADVDARRREVHERGRSAADGMRSTEPRES
jgi:hypothetical protein